MLPGMLLTSTLLSPDSVALASGKGTILEQRYAHLALIRASLPLAPLPPLSYPLTAWALAGDGGLAASAATVLEQNPRAPCTDWGCASLLPYPVPRLCGPWQAARSLPPAPPGPSARWMT